MARADDRGSSGARKRLDPTTYRRLVALLLVMLPLLLTAFVVVTLLGRPIEQGQQLRLDEFTTAYATGRIQNAVLYDRDARIVGDSNQGRYWVALPANNPIEVAAVLQGLTAAKVPIAVDSQFSKGLIGPFQVLTPALMLVDVFLLVLMFTQRPIAAEAQFKKAEAGRMTGGGGAVTFSEVAGVEEALEELREVRDYLAAPDRFMALGARVPRGILLQGPPGCGKTLLARAVAGEANVPFFWISGASFVELYVGVGAARIRDLFAEARAAAPAIIFIDEIDAVGRSRGPLSGAAASGGERETTLNQLLVEMDGFDGRSGIVVLAATNRPDILDTALLRPGRFDRVVPIDPPDVRGRAAILRIHGKGKPVAGDIDLDRLARRTPGFTGADLANVMNEAALLAVRRGRSVIANPDLDEAVERVMVGPQRTSLVMTVDDKRIAAYHETGHAICAHVLLPRMPAVKVSVLARGRSVGSTMLVAESEDRLATRDQLVDRIAVALGGRVAEEIGIGEASGGAQDDLRIATRIARQMVYDLGMGPRVGLISLSIDAQAVANGELMRPYSEELAAAADREVQAIIEEARGRAVEVIGRRRAVLESLAQLLIREETIDQETIASALRPVIESAPA